MRRTAPLLAALAGAAGGYMLLVRGALTLDLGIGRRIRPLGPIALTIGAPPETVFDVIAGPYLGRTPRALQGKLHVWERGSDMVLAAHRNPAGALNAVTVETVRFEPPRLVSFRLLRGPVPHVAERYELTAVELGTELVYSGELGTDLWRLGRWWGDIVARPWEGAVAGSLEQIRAEAERRASRRRRPEQPPRPPGAGAGPG